MSERSDEIPQRVRDGLLVLFFEGDVGAKRQNPSESAGWATCSPLREVMSERSDEIPRRVRILFVLFFEGDVGAKRRNPEEGEDTICSLLRG